MQSTVAGQQLIALSSLRVALTGGLGLAAFVTGCSVKTCPADSPCYPAQGGASSSGGAGAGGVSGNSGGSSSGGSSAGGSSMGGSSAGGSGMGGSSAGGSSAGGQSASTGGAAAAGGNKGSTGGKSSGGANSTGSGGKAGGSGGASTTGKWVNVTSNLKDIKDSECGNTGMVSAKPDEDMLIVGVSLHGLWASTDGGSSWHALGTGSGSAKITNRATSIVYDPTTPSTFWESGIYNAGGVYISKDDGVTFSSTGDIQHTDFVSVDLSDPARKTLLAGGHEQEKTLSKSTDGGANWTSVGSGLPAGTFCTAPLVIDSKTYLVGCSHYGDQTGIYRTIDGGSMWTKVNGNGTNQAPLRASDGSIYWVYGNGGGLVRSTDDGKNWTQQAGSGAIDSISVVELPDKRLAAVGDQRIVVSADQGKSWDPVTAELPYAPMTFTYSKQRKAFYISYFTCGNPPLAVPADAVMSYAFDYEAN
jgi:photosystem II stability/assembly factor-like uncharacterized protein